jgi:hypothetical protein
MSDYEDDFSDNRENINPLKRDLFSSRPVKMPLRNGSAAGESDSGYSLTGESSPSLCSQATTGLGPSDSEAGPDIADEEFRPANAIFKDPNAFDFLASHGEGSTSAAKLARESLYCKFDPLIAGRQSIMPPRMTQQVCCFHLKTGAVLNKFQLIRSFFFMNTQIWILLYE